MKAFDKLGQRQAGGWRSAGHSTRFMAAKHLLPQKEALRCRSVGPRDGLSAFEGKRLPANSLTLAPLSRFASKPLPGSGQASP